jgi:hypothetical protein
MLQSPPSPSDSIVKGLIEWPHFPNKLPRYHKKVRLKLPRRRKIETMLSLGTSTTLSSQQFSNIM